MSSKSNDSSKLALDFGGDATCTVRQLRDDELQKVSGGVRKGGAIIVYDYEGSTLRTQHPAKVTVPDLKLG